jgi:hypothetical protein
MKKYLIVIFSLLFIAGCASVLNPNTGEMTRVLDPNAVSVFQNAGETAGNLLGILGAFWPVLLPIAGYVSGAVRVSRKLTPELTRVQAQSEMNHTIAATTISGIEAFRKEFPKEWEGLMFKLDEAKLKIISPEDRLKIENIIRGLRGKPFIS